MTRASGTSGDSNVNSMLCRVASQSPGSKSSTWSPMSRTDCSLAGETCDDTIDTPACTVAPICGDDTQEAPEECDDGNLIDWDGCSALCIIE